MTSRIFGAGADMVALRGAVFVAGALWHNFG